MNRVLVRVILGIVVGLVLFCGACTFKSYTLTAGCVSYEGCGYTTKITLRFDANGLIIPPSDRFCPKCGKIIAYASVDGSDLINQYYERPGDPNEKAQIQDR